MRQHILKMLIGGESRSFESSYDLEESVRRLKDATRRSIFSSLWSQNAVGRVSTEKVALQRVIPFVGNSFKPFFIGRFERNNGRVVLSGRFTMHWFAKIFMAIWFGFVMFWTALASYQTIVENKGTWKLPLFGIGLISGGVVIVLVGRWFSRNDSSWLSRVITEALSNEEHKIA